MKFFLGVIFLFVIKSCQINLQNTTATHKKSTGVGLNSSSEHSFSIKLYKKEKNCAAKSFHELFSQKISGSDVCHYLSIKKSKLEKPKKKLYKCLPLRETKNLTSKVKLLNNTQLLKQLSKDNELWKKNHCTVVLFYAPWCPFSIRITPHYHALAYHFHYLDVVAIDAYNFSHSRYGAISVPTLIVFHDDKALAKFNSSNWDVENFIEFLNNLTGLSVNSKVELQERDYEGPLPTRIVKEIDYYLWMAWALIIACFIYGMRFYLRYLSFFTSIFDFASYRATHHHLD